MKFVNHNHFANYEGSVRVILYEYDKNGTLKVLHQYDAANWLQGVNALLHLDCLDDAAKIVIERSDLNK